MEDKQLTTESIHCDFNTLTPLLFLIQRAKITVPTDKKGTMTHQDVRLIALQIIDDVVCGVIKTWIEEMEKGDILIFLSEQMIENSDLLSLIKKN